VDRAAGREESQDLGLVIASLGIHRPDYTSFRVLRPWRGVPPGPPYGASPLTPRCASRCAARLHPLRVWRSAAVRLRRLAALGGLPLLPGNLRGKFKWQLALPPSIHRPVPWPCPVGCARSRAAATFAIQPTAPMWIKTIESVPDSDFDCWVRFTLWYTQPVAAKYDTGSNEWVISATSLRLPWYFAVTWKAA
jgi:hypothetical protein